MGTKPYLIFSLHHTRYAIAAEDVTEIFLLPELTPVVDSPPDVVGLLNLHSEYVPVMHLDLRFGHKFDQCHLTDSVIVVESQGLQIGVIVHRVETVNNIDDQYIQADLDYGRERKINQAFLKGVINLDDETIMLLNVDNLVRHPTILEALVDSENATSEVNISENNFYGQYFPDANFKTKEILQQRAANLKQAVDNTAATELIPIAVVNINGSYFGFDLGVVREFINIGRVTTIPCCPQHIIGNMNLRGEILTLVNICQSLNLAKTDHEQLHKAVVVEVDDIVVGIVVEEVYDVVDFPSNELKPIPIATNSDTTAYLKGLANYQDKTLKVVDLPKLLAQGEMAVDLSA